MAFTSILLCLLWLTPLGEPPYSRREQSAHLIVRGLREVHVPAPDSVKMEWDQSANAHRSQLIPELVTGRVRRDRRRYDDLRGPAPPKRHNCRAHCRSRRQTIVYEDHRLPAHIRGRARPPVETATPLELLLLSCCDAVDLLVRDS